MAIDAHICDVFFMLSFWACFVSCIVTIGILTPLAVASAGYRVPLVFRQMATSLILAIHHVNTRNNSIVGDAVHRLPDDFRIFYKISDTNFAMKGGVKSILDWRAQEGYDGFASSCGMGASTTINQSSWPSKPLYQSKSPNDKIIAIVGPDLSEIAQAVTVIAGLGGTPVTSFYSTSTTLSDKSRYPLFSRTVPVQSFNMIALANVMASFGWRKCAVILVDTEYGNAFTSEFQQRAGNAGINIVLIQKFKDEDMTSIQEGTDALKQCGARVFVFLAQGTTNLVNVLIAGGNSGIMGR